MGKYSIGKVANLANIHLSEFMDMIADLGIKSKIDEEIIVDIKI